jgi:hypothetical protein
MNAKKHAPPSQAEVERRFRELLEHGEIEDLSGWLDVPYDTLSKQLNPNNTTAKSDFYKAVRLLWALRQLGEEKAWKAIDLVTDFVFPSADEIQLVSRIENDVARLKTKLTGAAK